GAGDEAPQVDLGVVIHARSVNRAAADPRPDGPIGWGRPTRPAKLTPGFAPPSISIVDVTVTPDAVLSFGGSTIAVTALADSAAATTGDGRVSIRQLPPADVRVSVRFESNGEPTPARVRFVADDG